MMKCFLYKKLIKLTYVFSAGVSGGTAKGWVAHLVVIRQQCKRTHQNQRIKTEEISAKTEWSS